jgi:uncharacterized membrane protein
LNKRRLLILSSSLICIVIVTVGLLFWYSEQQAEQKLQDYIRRLEEEGFTIEEHSLSDVHVDGVVGIHFFGDFRSIAKQAGIDQISFDRGTHALYFVRPIIGDGVEANVFYY